MNADATGRCVVCGKPANVHMTEIRDGTKTSRSYCLEHAPAEMRESLPVGPHRTPADEVAYLRNFLKAAEAQLNDPAQFAEFKAGVEELIADIEAGRRRVGDAE